MTNSQGCPGLLHLMISYFFIFLSIYLTRICWQSGDNTVFFISIATNYQPIGFVKTPSAVSHLDWSPESFVRCCLLQFRNLLLNCCCCCCCCEICKVHKLMQAWIAGSVVSWETWLSKEEDVCFVLKGVNNLTLYAIEFQTVAAANLKTLWTVALVVRRTLEDWVRKSKVVNGYFFLLSENLTSSLV